MSVSSAGFWEGGGVRLDFSQFHDLMHVPFSRHCRDLYPHGWKAGWHHLKLDWQFRRKDQLRVPLQKILCRLDRHDVRVWYSGSKAEGTLAVSPQCHFCDFTRLPSEQELDNVPFFCL